jgi:hypothetical protein
MNDRLEDKLDELFRAGRRVKPDVTILEGGFESRLLERLEQNRQKGSSLFLWSWRLAPAMTILLLVLLVLNAVVAPRMNDDVLKLIANGYEQGQIKKYLTGE